MLRASANTLLLVQRLRERAARAAAGLLAHHSGRGRAPSDWHSASALWPDILGEDGDGK